MKLTIAGSYSEIRSWILDTARGLEKDQKDGHDWLGKLPSIPIAEDAGKAFGEYQRAASHTYAAPAEEMNIYGADADGLLTAVTAYFVRCAKGEAPLGDAEMYETEDEAEAALDVQIKDGVDMHQLYAVTYYSDGIKIRSDKYPDQTVVHTNMIPDEAKGYDYWKLFGMGCAPYLTNSDHVPEAFKKGGEQG